MNKKRWLSVSALGLAILIAALLGSQVMLANNALATSQDISGSWVINVVPEPATGVPPFTNLSSLTKDGVLIIANQAGLTSLGVWEKISNHTYRASFQGYEVSDGQTVRLRVRSTFELGDNKDHFSGPFITDFFDLDGNLLFSINGTVSADRMHVDPLQ